MLFFLIHTNLGNNIYCYPEYLIIIRYILDTLITAFWAE